MLKLSEASLIMMNVPFDMRIWLPALIPLGLYVVELAQHLENLA